MDVAAGIVGSNFSGNPDFELEDAAIIGSFGVNPELDFHIFVIGCTGEAMINFRTYPPLPRTL